jgi:hypothetical protein
MTTDTQPARTGNAPSHIAWHVRDAGPDRSFWNRVGVAWTNRDGSLSVHLDAVPLDGKVVLQVPKEKAADQPAA